MRREINKMVTEFIFMLNKVDVGENFGIHDLMPKIQLNKFSKEDVLQAMKEFDEYMEVSEYFKRYKEESLNYRYYKVKEFPYSSSIVYKEYFIKFAVAAYDKAIKNDIGYKFTLKEIIPKWNKLDVYKKGVIQKLFREIIKDKQNDDIYIKDRSIYCGVGNYEISQKKK